MEIAFLATGLALCVVGSALTFAVYRLATLADHLLVAVGRTVVKQEERRAVEEDPIDDSFFDEAEQLLTSRA